MKRLVIFLLRILIPALILGYLVRQMRAKEPEAITNLINQQKHWGRLLMATLICFLAYCLSFIRWRILVRSLGIPFRVVDALRLGFIGVLFGFVSLGSVGGDLFKAFFVAQEQPKRRAEVISTIFIDRVIGLYSLLLVTSVALLLFDVGWQNTELKVLAKFAWTLTAIATVFGMMFLLLPWSLKSVISWFRRWSFVEDALSRIDESLQLFRKRWTTLVGAVCVSVVIHLLLAMSVFVAATGLMPNPPSMQDHFLIWPVAAAAGAVPLAPGGLGTQEAAVSYMYALTTVPKQKENDPEQNKAYQQALGQGLLVGFTHRLMVIVIAAIGVIAYWNNRSKVRAALEAAEAEKEH